MKLKNLLESVNEILALTEGTGPLKSALDDFAASVDVPWVLGGGLAIGFHTRPRGTQDIDVFIADEDLAKVKASLPKDKFKSNREHAVVHRGTGVEVELLTPKHLGIDVELVRTAVETAIPQENVKVLSREGLIALKLQRGSYQDKADILNLIGSEAVDLSAFPLSSKNLEDFRALENEALQG